MSLVKGQFIDKTVPIQSSQDPVDGDDLARKSYVDTAAASAASGKLDASEVGVTVASLVDGKVPSTQLPSYVDDVLEFDNLAAFPATGENDKIYIAKDTNKVYRWSGSNYVEISASPGSTDAVPEGSINLYFTDERAAAAAPVQSVAGKTDIVTLDKSDVGLSNVDDTSDLDKPISTATQTALNAKQDSLGTGTTSQYLRGDLTWQEVSGGDSVAIAQTKYVTKGGDDATGDGSISSPYATIAAALASITDAAPTKRYVIKVEAGAYTEGALTLKANVFIVGSNNIQAVRVTASSVALASDFSGSADNRSGIGRMSLTGACDFNWSTVTSQAGKLYFSEVSFSNAVTLYGYNNAIAQAQFDSCIFFETFTVSGINVGIHTNNIHYDNIALNQHPGGGMATILAATGGNCSGSMTITTTVTDFNRRCSLFARQFFMESLTVDGASSYADVTSSSIPSAGPTVLNSGNVVYLNPTATGANTALSNLAFPTAVNQPIMPADSNATNLGDWGKQWFFNFNYVNGSSGTDLYLISTMDTYSESGDSVGRSIFINSDGYGLQADVNGGNIELETAAVSGTGVRGKVQIKARELDVTSSKITNVADGTTSSDAINKGQLDAAIAGVTAVVTGRKETITITSDDITNGYVDCSHLAIANTMILSTGGVMHQEGESYSLSTVGGVTRVTFSGDLVDPAASKLVAGDKVYLQYIQ